MPAIEPNSASPMPRLSGLGLVQFVYDQSQKATDTRQRQFVVPRYVS
ncbi:MAG: hypothetical protein VCF25_23295 [Candidatus Poribacteria bacterium]